MHVVLDNLGLYLDGARTTVFLTVSSFAAAFVVGILVAAWRVSPVPPLRGAGTVWVGVFRNTPLLVLFLLFLNGLTKVGIRFPELTTAVIVLAVYTSTFVGETVRAGINAVSRGQAEAARAIGLTFPQTLASVVLPQAVRSVVAPLGNVFIALIKNSAIASVFVHDIIRVADDLSTETAQPVPVFLGAATAYLLLTLPSGFLVGAIERRVAVRR